MGNEKDDRELLRQVARQLNQWAEESITGGWSTQQVDPQRELAAAIHRHLDKVTP